MFNEANNKPESGKRGIESTEEPTYGDVKQFQLDSFSADMNSSQRKSSPEIISEEEFINAQDQIIRGWVYRRWFLNLTALSPQLTDDQKVGAFDLLEVIPEHERQYPGFDWFKNDIPYGIIYVKGHGMEKVFFFEWTPTVVFYCPDSPKNEDKLSPFTNRNGINSKPLTNRFFKEGVFHYLDRKRQYWISFPFGHFDKIDNRFGLQPFVSSDCTKTRITALSRIR